MQTNLDTRTNILSQIRNEPYQGKQYTDEEYTKLNNMLLRRIGTLNCGHAAFPVILGVNDPQYSPEELEQMRLDNEAGVTIDGRHYTTYEATQRQRKYERSIRNQKRKILIDETLGDKDQLQTDQIRLVRLRDEYKRFSKDAGLPMQHDRMDTAGFTWKHGKAAEKTEKALQHNSQIASTQKKTNQDGYSVSSEFSSDLKWDSSIGFQSWDKASRKAIYSAEYSTVDKKYEIAQLYDGQGKRIFEKNGSSSFVTFTTNEIKQMRGAVLTHNHPNGTCFSPKDINMLRRGKLLEIRAVTPKGVYRLQKPSKWSKDISGLEKINSMYYDIDKEVSPAVFARAAHGDISYAEADALSQELVIQEFAKRYGMGFGFDTWEDIRREMD